MKKKYNLLIIFLVGLLFSSFSLSPYAFCGNFTFEQEFSVIKIVKIPLGGNAMISKYIIGEVYVPTKWGGKLSLLGSNIQLFYTNGSDLDSDTAIKIFNGELNQSQVAQGNPCEYNINENKHGWYYVKVTGTESDVIVQNFFEQEGELSKSVWYTGHWWSFYNGEEYKPHMYDDDGPLAKYDEYIGHSKPDPESAQKWELEHWHYRTNPDDWWTGHCDGVAAGGLIENEPTAQKTVDGVVFSIINQKGLIAERWVLPNVPENYEFDKYDSRDPDYTPKWFHKMLYERIGNTTTQTGFCMDKDTGISSWNVPVYKYNAEFVAKGINDGNEKKIDIRTTLTYKKGTGGVGSWSHTSETFVSKYDLEYDANGDISIEGTWDNASEDQPDNVFYPKSDKQPSNPKVKIKRINEIIH